MICGFTITYYWNVDLLVLWCQSQTATGIDIKAALKPGKTNVEGSDSYHTKEREHRL